MPSGLKERFDGKLVVGLARDRLAHQRRMVQRVRRVAAAGPRVECKSRRARVAAVAQYVLPGPVIGRAVGLGTQAGGVIEQLLDA